MPRTGHALRSSFTKSRRAQLGGSKASAVNHDFRIHLRRRWDMGFETMAFTDWRFTVRYTMAPLAQLTCDPKMRVRLQTMFEIIGAGSRRRVSLETVPEVCRSRWERTRHWDEPQSVPVKEGETGGSSWEEVGGRGGHPTEKEIGFGLGSTPSSLNSSECRRECWQGVFLFQTVAVTSLLGFAFCVHGLVFSCSLVLLLYGR